VKKKTPDLKTVPKTATDLQMFQEQYGADWQKIMEMPAFRAGLQLLNIRKLDQIASLTPEVIEQCSVGILSELIGQLRHENQIFNLHKEKEFRFPLEEEDIYVSPEEEAEHQKLREKFSEQARKQRYGSG
jgi:hypothetical protein